jgi:hypothetical protein
MVSVELTERVLPLAGSSWIQTLVTTATVVARGPMGHA